MKSKRKKNKLPIVILLMVALTISLSSGIVLGKYSVNIGNDFFSGQFDIKQLWGDPKGVSDSLINPEGEKIVEVKPVPENNDDGYETTYIYEKVNPSVVSIDTYSSQSISPVGGGTGIIMTHDGYIITNAHVVLDSTSVNVIFEDGRQSRGVIVGYDETTDLALIKVEETGLTPAEFGDSSQLKEGERVVAIGNAGGLSSTITQGIISGLNRDLGEGARSIDLIQVDAAINPGNSGGPLSNRWGQVVGINSSKIASVEFEGIGFSIPITEALPILQSIMQNGYVTGRAVLGVSVVGLNDSNGPPNGLPSKGVYIAEIQENSDLLSQGVRTRDVIVEADDKQVGTADDLLTILDGFSPGDTIKLKVYRVETDETFEVFVKLIEAVN